MLRLGKSTPRYDPRTLQMARFTAPLPQRPKSVLYGAQLTWPMYANDQYGDCTIAAKWHMIEAWTRGKTTTSAKVIADYMRLSGGRDDGLVMLDVLNDWRRSRTHPIHAYAQIEHLDAGSVSDAVYLFGGVYLGVALPAYLEHRLEHGAWEWTPRGALDTGSDAPGSWGGHAVNIVGYGSRGVWLVTWGRRVRCSWSFLARYADEAYAVISRDWLAKTGRDRHGFSLAQLDADLKAIR